MTRFAMLLTAVISLILPRSGFAQRLGLGDAELQAMRSTYKAGYTSWAADLSGTGKRLLFDSSFPLLFLTDLGEWYYPIGDSPRMGKELGTKKDPVVVEHVLGSDSLIRKAVQLNRITKRSPLSLLEGLSDMLKYAPNPVVRDKLLAAVGRYIRDLPSDELDVLKASPHAVLAQNAIGSSLKVEQERIRNFASGPSDELKIAFLTNYVAGAVSVHAKGSGSTQILKYLEASNDSVALVPIGEARGDYLLITGDIQRLRQAQALNDLPELIRWSATKDIGLFYTSVWSDSITPLKKGSLAAALKEDSTIRN